MPHPSCRIFSIQIFYFCPGSGVRECPPWCSIVGVKVTVHKFFCILQFGKSSRLEIESIFGLKSDRWRRQLNFGRLQYAI